MIAVPSADPVGALVPHTLKEPLIGGSSGPLAGTSFMVKDLFAIKGRKVSNGSPDFYGHATPARETAPVITRLLAAGASCTGITVCDEFFYSVLGSNIHYGQPVNARAPKHVTGGSSCGAAAAVAASMCNFALGTDTAGSIRVPASFCGLYGLRPTYGRIDTTGATPMAPSYDTVGFLARDSELFRKVGHVLLQGAEAETKIERLILAENFFRHAEASMDQALWDAMRKIGGACPDPSTWRLTVRRKLPPGATPSASFKASRSNRRCCPSFSRTLSSSDPASRSDSTWRRQLPSPKPTLRAPCAPKSPTACSP